MSTSVQAGARLTFWRTKRLRKTLDRVYRSRRTDCAASPRHTACVEQRQEGRRELVIASHAAWRAKRATEAGRAALQVRQQSVVPVLGSLKSVLGLRQFLFRDRLEGVSDPTIRPRAGP